MCPHCRAFITTSDRVCPYCNESVGPRAADRERSPGGLFGGFVPHARFVTVLILLINFGMYIATTLFSLSSGNRDAVMNPDVNTLFFFGAQNPRAIFGLHQWWRLVTAGFLHGGILHILMNSWVLFDLGAEVEEVYGQHRLITIYFLSTVCGFLASAAWGTYLSVGASAGLFGLIGAMIALGTRYKSGIAGAIRGMYIRWAVYGIVLGFLPGLRMDNAAHIGGVAAGFAVGYAAGVPSLSTGMQERAWRVAAYLSIALTAFCFLQMLLWFSRITR